MDSRAFPPPSGRGSDRPPLRLATYNTPRSADAADSVLRERLEALLRGRKPAAVARLVEMHPETVRRYMKGGTPSAEFVRRLCDVFGVSADWLLCGRAVGPAGPLAPSTSRSVAEALEAAASQIRSEALHFSQTGGTPRGWVVLPLTAAPGAS